VVNIGDKSKVMVRLHTRYVAMGAPGRGNFAKQTEVSLLMFSRSQVDSNDHTHQTNEPAGYRILHLTHTKGVEILKHGYNNL